MHIRVFSSPAKIYAMKLTIIAGLSQISMSARESRALADESKCGIPSLARQLYFDGVQYSLRGLPKNLSNEEGVSLWASCPSKLREIAIIEATHRIKQAEPTNSRRNDLKLHVRKQQSPSVVHRILAAIVFRMFMLIQFFVPYIRCCVAELYSCGRRYRISQRGFRLTVKSVDFTVKAASTVLNMKEGRVRNAAQGVILWWITSIAGGVQEGIGNGLQVLGMEKKRQGHVEQNLVH
jgi:hypothetical protein